MSTAPQWSPAYLADVAGQIVWNYQFIWNRIREVDPSLTLSRLREHEAAVRAGRASDEEVNQLHAEVARFRAVGARLFDTPAGIPDLIFCTCDFPFAWRGIPRPEEMAPGQVEVFHMGDMPANAEDWRQRARIAELPNLLALYLFHSGLGVEPFGIDTRALSKLRVLDLRENGLTAVPPEALACVALEYLDLRDNPLQVLPDLSGKTSLRWLGLARTALPRSAVDAARRQLPGCQIG